MILKLIIGFLFIILIGCANVNAQSFDKPPTISTNLEMICRGHNDMVRQLFEGWRETIRGAGAISTNHGPFVLAILVGPQGTFSFVLTGKDGRACMILYGRHWRFPTSPERKTER